VSTPFLSVLIPAFREATQIADAVTQARLVADEVVVADGGSDDGTVELARGAGATVVMSPKGRGPQLDAAARASTGEALLFLHADARLPPQARGCVQRALAEPAIVGGNFHLRFVPHSGWAQLFSGANHLRRRLFCIYYGDSAIFVRRRVYDALGGFRALPILEDYEFVRRLERHGKTAYVREVSVTASARRFQRAPVRTLAAWTMLQALYSAGVSAERLAAHYHDAR
jgi:rSAM/selenodomain-associated transferase 2